MIGPETGIDLGKDTKAAEEEVVVVGDTVMKRDARVGHAVHAGETRIERVIDGRMSGETETEMATGTEGMTEETTEGTTEEPTEEPTEETTEETTEGMTEETTEDAIGTTDGKRIEQRLVETKSTLERWKPQHQERSHPLQKFQKVVQHLLLILVLIPKILNISTRTERLWTI
jgi:TATA-binding protein-associated factor Taf7